MFRVSSTQVFEPPCILAELTVQQRLYEKLN